MGRTCPSPRAQAWQLGLRLDLAPLDALFSGSPYPGHRLQLLKAAAQPLTSLPGALYAACRLPKAQVCSASPRDKLRLWDMKAIAQCSNPSLDQAIYGLF